MQVCQNPLRHKMDYYRQVNTRTFGFVENLWHPKGFQDPEFQNISSGPLGDIAKNVKFWT